MATGGGRTKVVRQHLTARGVKRCIKEIAFCIALELRLVVSLTQRAALLPEPKEFLPGLWQKMFRIGIRPDTDARQIHKIIALNIANLIGILPLRLILGINYALAGEWPSAILMAIAFTTVSTIVILRMGGHLSHGLYRQATIVFTFICPVLLTFLLGGYEASSNVIIWSLLCPMLGLLIGEPKTALRWFYLFILANGLVLVAQSTVMNDPESPITWRHSLDAFNIIGVGRLLFIGLRYFFKQRNIAIEKLDRFAALAAHELRNPVSTVLIALNHLRRSSGELSDSNQKALHAATRETERCKHLLHDLLDLSRGKESAMISGTDVTLSWPYRHRMALGCAGLFVCGGLIGYGCSP